MIILVGGPGSGKSTQGQLLADRGRLRWISMSDILRRNVSEEYLEKMRNGEVFSGSVVFNALSAELQALGDKPELILDGFPRSVDQTKWLLEQNDSGNLKVTAVVYLYVDKEIVKNRMILRGRVDDSLDTITKRFNEFERASKPAIDKLAISNIPFIEISANKAPDKILDDIVNKLQALGVDV